MAQIHNSDLFKELKEGAKIQQLKDNIPNQLAEKVVPVMEVNPKLLRRCKVVKSSSLPNATTGTLYTTPADKDFYLVAAQMSVIKDATATSTYSKLNVIPKDGVAQTGILRIEGLTLTAQSETTSINLNIPLLLERNSIIQMQNSTNVGNVTSSYCVIGFEVENINA